MLQCGMNIKRKAESAEDLPPYECQRHGKTKAIVRIRKNGYLHRRCHECYKAVQRRAVGAWNKKERLRCRALVLDSYGGRCECCAESNYGFLSIDHINNDGKEHRKEIRNGIGIYYWLVKREFPRDGRFRILCYNCNLGRAHHGGTCPHVSESQQS